MALGAVGFDVIQSDLEQAGRFILSSRRKDGHPLCEWHPALVQATVRSRWPSVSTVEAYREASRLQARERVRGEA